MEAGRNGAQEADMVMRLNLDLPALERRVEAKLKRAVDALDD